MKKFIKTIVSLTAVSAMLLSTTAFAASTQTVTKYSADGTTVTSTVNGLTEGSMVTYLAHKGDAVNADGSNIVYIGQETVDSDKSATFTYNVTDVTGAGVYATVKYGSNVDAIADTNSIEIGKVTVTWDQVAGEVTGDVLVGSGDEVQINLTAATGSEIVKITKNGQAVEIQNTIKAKAGDQIVVTAIPTEGNPAVYQLKGATIDSDYDDKYYTNVGIVRVIGDVGEVYFQFENRGGEIYSLEGQTKFSISDIIEAGGYYGVEVVDVNDISAYEAVAYVNGEKANVIE
jgi:hypothetical protein